MPYRKYENPDILDYLSKRYDRGNQMRGLLNQFVLMKRLKEERAKSEKEWRFKERSQLGV